MKSKISRSTGLTVVELSGYLSFESTVPLTETMDAIFKENKDAQVIVDLKNLEFVGSSGVSTFVKTLRSYNTLKMKPFYFGVKSEFLRLFRAFEEDKTFEVMESRAAAEQAAVSRYEQWEINTLRSKKTH